MPNRCVATGCGNMPCSISLIRFPKDPNLSAFFDQTSSANAGALDQWTPSSAISVSISSTKFQR